MVTQTTITNVLISLVSAVIIWFIINTAVRFSIRNKIYYFYVDDLKYGQRKKIWYTKKLAERSRALYLNKGYGVSKVKRGIDK